VLAKTVMGFSDFVHEHRPDLVVIHGDRVEAMAASIVCAMRYIPSAHIEGGEVSGTIDESIRHCNTKLCSSHFVSSEDARLRVLALGEEPERVFVIGSPELDVHAQPSGVTINEVMQRYAIEFAEYGIVIFHPVTSEQKTIGAQAESLFKCLKKSDKNFVVILPNNDPGTDEISSVLEQLPTSQFRLIPSMRFAYFSELIRNARVIVGNSSVGVREAPFLGIPSLNIGSRQNQRASSSSIYNCASTDRASIAAFLSTQWGVKHNRATDFGAGNSASQFLEILSSEHYWILTHQKTFHNHTNTKL
jgi:UDP-N-acetylglucosamine 2-epimerase (hydrolysing)